MAGFEVITEVDITRWVEELCMVKNIKTSLILPYDVIRFFRDGSPWLEIFPTRIGPENRRSNLQRNQGHPQSWASLTLEPLTSVPVAIGGSEPLLLLPGHRPDW
jgi:hypothetical protein